MSRLILVCSPLAGRSRELARARREMAAIGLEVGEELPIAELPRLPDLLLEAGPEPLVVAAGGDGTVGAVADRLANSEAVLGVLPLGTSNDFARSLGIPVHVRRAVRLLREGKVATVDLGRVVVPGRPPAHFVHAATVGLNVSFAKLATRASWRRRLGRLTYVVAALVAFRERRSFACRLVREGGDEEVRLTHLSVINAPVFGGFLGLRVPGSDPDDRLLDVLAVEELAVWRVLLAGLYQLFRVRRRLRGVHAFHTGRLQVHTAETLEVALDGEVAGRLPADFVVAGEALRVVTPRSFVDQAG